MPRNAEQKIKLLVLYDILQKNTDADHALNTDEIIAELNKRGVSVTRKVLPSDIETLNEYGFEVLSYKKKFNYYYAIDHLFDTAEVVMIADAIKASKLTVVQKNKMLDKLFSTMGAYLSRENGNTLISLETKSRSNRHIIYSIDSIDKAIKEHKKLSFLYYYIGADKKKQYRKEGKRYVVNPLVMIWSNDNYYLLSYDDTHDDTVTYRIDRMEDVKVEDIPRLEKKQFENFNTEEYRKQVFSMFGGELERVELICTDEMVEDIIDRFGEDVPIYKMDDNSYRVIVDVQISKTFFLWVLGSMGKVRITSPTPVQEKFKEFFDTLKESY
jgi:predicted DNA-binding transcriptional regulator YafY